MKPGRSTDLSQKPGWLFLASSMMTTLAVTWPIATQAPNTSLGSPNGDHIKHLWNLWWVRTSWAQDPEFPLFTRLINAPEGIPFWPIEPLHGLAALLLPGLGVAPLSDLLAFVNLVLAGLFTSFLVHALTRSVSAAICAGFLFQVSSFPAFAIEVGVGELQHTWLLPLGALCLWRLWRHPTRTRALIAGAVLGFTPLVSFYLGLYTAATATTLTLAWWWFGRGPRPNQRLFALAAAMALVMALVVVWIFAGTYGSPVEQDHSFLEVVFSGALDSRAVNPPATRLSPMELFLGEQVRGSSDATAKTYGAGRLLGFPVLVLAGLAMVRRPRESGPWAVLAITGAILSLGSFLCVGGNEVQFGSTRLALPFLLLNRALALVAEPLHFPARFLVITQLSLAVMSGIALSTLGSGRARALAGLLVLLQFVDVRARSALPTPLSVTTPPELLDLTSLQNHEGHALLDLTMLWQTGTRNRRLALFGQMAHHHPVNTIALERIDRFAYDGTHIACALDMAKGLHSSFVGLPSPHQRELDPVPDLYFLNRMGFTEIAVSLPAGSVPARLNSLLGSPVAESDSMVIWPIPDVVPARAAETVEWDDRYERRLAQLEKEGCIFTGGKPKGPVADLEEKAAELDTLELPAEPPFLARTRQAPVTMVNAEGKPSEVLEALAVEVEVLEWNDAAARVRCTGCREELVGWVPTNQLLVEELDPNRTEDRLARFLLLATQQNPALAAGVQDNGSEWIAPPWAQEEDYSGTSWSIRESGVSFVLDAAPASVDDKLEEAAGAATK